MKFTVEYPTERRGYSSEFLDPTALVRFAQAAEAAGFDAIAFSEHPAPSRKWLDAGGHHTLDPLAALSFCAAVTSRIKLMPHLLVLPYHNPLQLTKTLATLDILSSGRIVMAAGTGYLRSEYAAVGVDFDERNALFDEAVEAISTAWSGEPFSFQGRHFEVLDQALRPTSPRPLPPLWIGGNSALTRRRVARYGQGWSPIITGDLPAESLRTGSIASLDELAEAVKDLAARVREAGRNPAELDVQIEAPGPAVAGGLPDVQAHIDQLHRYANTGVTSVFVHVPAEGTDAALDAVAEYGSRVIAASR